MPFTPMSPILVAGATIAMRFIFAGFCARAASGHVAAVPPKSVMNSRRCMHPPEGKTHRRLKPNTLRRGGGEKGQPIDPRRCDPMSVRGQKRKWRRFQVMSALPHKADIDARDCDVRFVPKHEIAARKPAARVAQPRVP